MAPFPGLLNSRSLLLFAAPLLVGSTLLWQHQSTVTPQNQTAPQPHIAENTPPPGISPDEWQTARAEFDGLTDSTFQCAVEEMPAYWRLLKWSTRQPETDRDQNSFTPVAYNELVNKPTALRGAPVQIDLHIRRIVSYPAPENSLGIDRLYEVWGWSDDSRGSLYVAVTPELPAGMNTGESVTERATLHGYFYKIQGYLAAGSTPQQSHSTAPLIIGRLLPWRAPVAAIAQPHELWSAAALLLLAASFFWLLSHRPLFRLRYRKTLDQIAPHATTNLETWLDSHPAVAELS